MGKKSGKFGKDIPKMVHFPISMANFLGGQELFSSPFVQKLFYSPPPGGADLAGILTSEEIRPLMRTQPEKQPDFGVVSSSETCHESEMFSESRLKP